MWSAVTSSSVCQQLCKESALHSNGSEVRPHGFDLHKSSGSACPSRSLHSAQVRAMHVQNVCGSVVQTPETDKRKSLKQSNAQISGKTDSMPSSLGCKSASSSFQWRQTADRPVLLLFVISNADIQTDRWRERERCEFSVWPCCFFGTSVPVVDSFLAALVRQGI